MKKLLFSLLPAFLFIGAAASADILGYDGFSTDDYTAGSTVNTLGGGSGWATSWDVDLSGSLNNHNRYHGTAYSLGYTDTNANSLVTTPGALEAKAAGAGAGGLSRTFASPVSGEIWFSFLNIRTSTESWGWDLQFQDASGTAQFQIQNNSATGNFRLNQGGATSNLALTNHTTDEFPQGQFFVGRVTNAGSGSANATLSVWINPNNLLDLNDGAAATAALANRQVNTIAQFAFIKGTNHTGFFDEFRVGATGESVMPVPEPSTWALWAGLLSLGALAWRRRRA